MNTAPVPCVRGGEWTTASFENGFAIMLRKCERPGGECVTPEFCETCNERKPKAKDVK